MKILHAIVVIIFSSLITLSGGGFNILHIIAIKQETEFFHFKSQKNVNMSMELAAKHQITSTITHI